MYEYAAKVINIVDGDTFDLEVDLGFKISHKIRARLLEIDTPEKFNTERPLGEICKQYAEKTWLNKEVIINSEKDSDINTDSFGRWLIKIRTKDGFNAIDDYNRLGINKLSPSYSELNVKKVEEKYLNG